MIAYIVEQSICTKILFLFYHFNKHLLFAKQILVKDNISIDHKLKIIVIYDFRQKWSLQRSLRSWVITRHREHFSLSNAINKKEN